jgi:hypothetical protein
MARSLGAVPARRRPTTCSRRSPLPTTSRTTRRLRAARASRTPRAPATPATARSRSPPPAPAGRWSPTTAVHCRRSSASDGGTDVTYDVSATDDRDGDVKPVCDPPSGSSFPIGTTIVTCSADGFRGQQGRREVRRHGHVRTRRGPARGARGGAGLRPPITTGYRGSRWTSPASSSVSLPSGRTTSRRPQSSIPRATPSPLAQRTACPASASRAR